MARPGQPDGTDPLSDRGAPQLAGILALGAIAWIVAYWMWPTGGAQEPQTSMSRATDADLTDPSVDDPNGVELMLPEPQPDPDPVPDPDPEPDNQGDTDAQADDTGEGDGEGAAIEPPTYRIHTVAAGGETLQDISRIYYNTTSKWRAIARMNGHSVDPNRLFPGTEGKVPRDPDNVQGLPMDDELPPAEPEVEYTEYIVSRNASLWTIAKSLYGSGVKWTVIRDANRDLVGSEGGLLRPGMVLRIPPPSGDAGG